MWHVDVLECNDNTQYTGISTNLNARVQRHNYGKGAQYTKVRRPVKLVYYEKFASKADAQIREIEIKSLSVKNKKKLIKFGNGQRFPSDRMS